MRTTPLSVAARTVFAAVVVLAVVLSGTEGHGAPSTKDFAMSPVAQPTQADELALQEAETKGGSGRGAASGAAAGDVILSLINADSGGEVAKQLVTALADNLRFNGFSVIAIQQETYDRPQDLSGIEYVNLGNAYDASQNKWDVYVFKSGTFTNKGDLGFENWFWVGYVASRSDDGRTVTFDSPGLAEASGAIDSSEDPSVEGPPDIPDTSLEKPQDLVRQYAESEKYAGYSVIIIQQETYDEPKDLKGVRYKKEGFSLDAGSGNRWDFFVFKSGTFENTGDLGPNNWYWSGYVASRSEDGRTVTFDSPGPEPVAPDPSGDPSPPPPLLDEYLVDSARELVKDLVDQYAAAEVFSGYSVIMIQQETYDGPQDLEDVRYEKKGINIGETENSGDDNRWDFFVFKSGTFENTGDLGSNNWYWSGYVASRSEDGRTVTFGNPAPPEPPVKDRDVFLKLMPLGDSVTDGVGSSYGNGYRQDLLTRLADGGSTVDLVGRNRSGTMSDPDHEGYSGRRIAEVFTNAQSSIEAFQPNVVTLMAGTNDLDQGFDPAGAPQRLGTMIQQIRTLDDGVVIVVATLPDSSDANLQSLIDGYNTQVATYVSRSKDDHVLLADTGAVTTADMSDTLHPNDSGYDKIAAAFAREINRAIDDGWVREREHDPSPPQVDRPGPTGAPSRDLGAVVWYEQGTIATGVGSRAEDVELADVDGDGRDDYLSVADNGAVKVWLNGGSSPGANGNWLWYPQGTVATGVGSSRGAIRFADLDGDGRDDYLSVADNGAVKVWLNGGSSPGANGNWLWYPQGTVATGVGSSRGAIRFADLDGDGRDDYLSVADNGAVKVWLNGGSSPGANGNWLWYPQGTVATGVGSSRGAIRFADINRDGFDDYLSVADNGAVKVWLNGGSSPGTNGNWLWYPQGTVATGVGAPGAQVRFADLDDDFRADYVVLTPESGAMRAWLN